KSATSILDYVFRELAVSYLGRHDLAHVDVTDISNTTLGKGISEGKPPISKGLTRGQSLSLIAGKFGGEPKGMAGETARPASPVHAVSGSAATGLAVRPASQPEEAKAFRRDYEEATRPATEAGEIADAEETPAQRQLEDSRRAQAVLMGYTGNSCPECQNFTMVRNGTCEKCDTCGATSGCS